MDIVVSPDDHKVGFLAVTSKEFAEEIMEIISLPRGSRDDIRKAARGSMARFSEEEFERSWFDAVKGIVALE